MVTKNHICCGCSACAIICPKGAIRMGWNEKGNYTPSIDKHNCIDCGLCEQVCPMLHPTSVPLSQENVFVSVAKNRDVLKKSSSGGVAYVIAKTAIEREYAVCGVTYNPIKEQAEHTVLNRLPLEQIQGSKYLQSATESAFREIISHEKGIVFGTPCQIAGLDAILKKKHKRERFLLVDIFCHGVPSQLLWRQHLNYLKANKRISGDEPVIFRQGKNFRVSIGSYQAWYNEDAFYTFFLRGWLKNDSCYTCPFRRNGCSDIRLGDLMEKKYEKVSFSPSCIIVNTPQGEAFLQTISSELELYPERYETVDSVQEKENSKKPENYDFFLSELQNGKYPENLIRTKHITRKIKSLIKNEFLLKLRQLSFTNDLSSAVDNKKRK